MKAALRRIVLLATASGLAVARSERSPDADLDGGRIDRFRRAGL